MDKCIVLSKILLFNLLAFLMLGCDRIKSEKKTVIGLSQCMLDDAWRQTMLREVMIEASNYDDIELVIRNADTNNKQQIEQIKELIEMQVDVLIISPNESEALTPVAEEAFKAGIPTIITDRKVNTELYTTFVGASNYEIGLNAGVYARNHLTDGAVILEIWGLATSSPAQERHEGFTEAISDLKDVKVLRLEGQWRYDTTAVSIARAQLPDSIDFVYAHNDMMAIAAREFFMRKDSVKGKALHIIGVDAVPGAGLEAVADGRINTSFMYPTGGEQIVRAAVKLAKGEAVERFIPLQSALVDRSIAKTLLLQADQIAHYQQRIENQRSKLDQLFKRYGSLQNSMTIISLLLITLLLLIVYVYYINRKIHRTNRELREINAKEEEQRHKLIALNAEIKEVTAHKLQFFTNVSHEVRTPLTLILSPLSKLAAMLQQTPYIDDIKIIQKNAQRLLNVINQLLDFRKIENNKERLKLREVDIVGFTREVMTYFDSVAAVRNIRYEFHSNTSDYKIRLDGDKIERTLVNLLSNAFKYTRQEGMVKVSVNADGDKVQIIVEDNGCGIRPENIPYVFNRFYTEGRAEGTGIGLHLANEYVRMHKGEISVESEPEVFSRFAVTLYRTVLNEEVTDVSPLAYVALQTDSAETEAIVNASYPYTVLIVEDDEDVREYLARELAANFGILTASDGRQALAMLEEDRDVSLVVSDVMMPIMNGFELCRHIKNTLSVSHIPVILLTALTDERQRLYGVTGGADDYINKPFNINYLRLKIIRLLDERRKLRKQLLQRLQDNHLLLAEPDKAENMDDRFLRRFISQIEEVYAEPEYNIERLSSVLGLSRGHLHRKVKELTGLAPVDYLRNYRLAKAAALLRQSNLNISEIAYQTGFTSPNYFAKCFRTVYNQTPTEYASASSAP